MDRIVLWLVGLSTGYWVGCRAETKNQNRIPASGLRDKRVGKKNKASTEKLSAFRLDT